MKETIPSIPTTLPEQPRLVSDMVERRSGDRTLLLSPRQGSWCVVDALGYRLARQCDGQTRWPDLARNLAAEYGVEAGQVVQDVQTYLQQLARAGLLAGSTVLPAGDARPGLPDSPGQSARPAQVTLLITPYCNLRCRHCCQASEAGDAAHSPLPTLATLRNRMDQAVSAGAERLTLTGGEPLTHPDWREIVRYAAAQLPTTVLTNGMLIDEAAADLLSATGVTVQVSVDGPSAAVHEALRGPRTFAPTMAGIQRLLERGMGARLIWSVCVNRHNLSGAAEIVAGAMARDVAQIYLRRINRQGAAARHWDDLAVSEEQMVDLLHRLKPWFAEYPGRINLAGCESRLALARPKEGQSVCPLGDAALIDTDGAIYPCSLLIGSEYRLGNAAEEGLLAAVRSPRMEHLRALMLARAERVGSCRRCSWHSFCRGACPGMAWVQNGDWWSTDDLCRVRDALFTQTIFQCAERKDSSPPCQPPAC